jgi:hypothetical protein
VKRRPRPAEYYWARDQVLSLDPSQHR